MRPCAHVTARKYSVLLTERRSGVLYTKPISEDMGPIEDRCPTRIINQLTEPSHQHAREWRQRCRARLTKPCPRQGRSGGGSNEARESTLLDATCLRATALLTLIALVWLRQVQLRTWRPVRASH
jgi:hypothetical protein